MSTPRLQSAEEIVEAWTGPALQAAFVIKARDKADALSVEQIMPALEPLLERIDLSDDQVFDCLYYAYITQKALQSELPSSLASVTGQDNQKQNKSSVCGAIYSVLIQELACRRDGIARAEFNKKFNEQCARLRDSSSSNSSEFIRDNSKKLYQVQDFVELRELQPGEFSYTNERNFQDASLALKQAVQVSKQNPDSPLKAAGRLVLQKVMHAKEKNRIVSAELPTLTKFITGAANVIIDPSDENINKHTENTKEVVGMNFYKKRFIRYAVLSFAGALLCALSAAALVATFGFSAPISAMGLALGGSMFATGIALSLSCSAGAGFAIVMGIFAHRTRKGNIALAGENLSDKAKAQYNASVAGPSAPAA